MIGHLQKCMTFVVYMYLVKVVNDNDLLLHSCSRDRHGFSYMAYKTAICRLSLLQFKFLTYKTQVQYNFIIPFERIEYDNSTNVKASKILTMKSPF